MSGSARPGNNLCALRKSARGSAVPSSMRSCFIRPCMCAPTLSGTRAPSAAIKKYSKDSPQCQACIWFAAEHAVTQTVISGVINTRVERGRGCTPAACGPQRPPAASRPCRCVSGTWPARPGCRPPGPESAPGRTPRACRGGSSRAPLSAAEGPAVHRSTVSFPLPKAPHTIMLTRTETAGCIRQSVCSVCPREPSTCQLPWKMGDQHSSNHMVGTQTRAGRAHVGCFKSSSYVLPSCAGLVVRDGQIPHLDDWEAHHIVHAMLVHVSDACMRGALRYASNISGSMAHLAYLPFMLENCHHNWIYYYFVCRYAMLNMGIYSVTDAATRDQPAHLMDRVEVTPAIVGANVLCGEHTRGVEDGVA